MTACAFSVLLMCKQLFLRLERPPVRHLYSSILRDRQPELSERQDLRRLLSDGIRSKRRCGCTCRTATYWKFYYKFPQFINSFRFFTPLRERLDYTSSHLKSQPFFRLLRKYIFHSSEKLLFMALRQLYIAGVLKGRSILYIGVFNKIIYNIPGGILLQNLRFSKCKGYIAASFFI